VELVAPDSACILRIHYFDIGGVEDPRRQHWKEQIPFGIAVFFGMNILVVCLTGFYVQRSNSRFDQLTRDIRQEWDR